MKIGMLLFALLTAGSLRADNTPVAPRKRTAEEKHRFFEHTIRPLFVAKCVDCHSGDESAESALSYESRESLLAGGDFGPSIIPGRAADSTLIRAVKRTHKELRMPPDDDWDYEEDDDDF